jgi:hypothetical protein
MSNCSTTLSTLATSTTALLLKIDGMSPLFWSNGEIGHMMRFLVFYHACLDLSVNCKYLVSMWLCLYACWSYGPPLGLIKLILNHVNFITIQKPNLIDMAGLSDALKPEWFTGGDNFNRWQTRVKFWLMSMKILWVIFPVLPLTEEQHREYELENSTCIGCLLSLLSDQLCDIYMHHTSTVNYGMP